MKRLVAVLAAAVAGSLLMADAPVRAAEPMGPYTIKGGAKPTWFRELDPGRPSGSVTEQAFSAARRCSAEFLNTPLQGLDSYILDVSDYAGMELHVNWTSPSTTPSRMYLNLYNQYCVVSRTSESHPPGPVSIDDPFGTLNTVIDMTFAESNSVGMVIPEGGHWLAVTPEAKVDVSFTVTLAPLS